MLYVDCFFNINFEMIHVDAFSCSLFISLLQSVLLYAQTTAFLSILQSTDIWVIFSILWIFLYTSLNAYIEEILWGIYPQVDYCVIAYMQMKLSNVELFSKRWLYPCTLHPVNSVFEIPPFIHLHLLLIFSEFLFFASLRIVKWYLILICISFNTEYERHFICYTCASSSVKYSHSFAHILTSCFSLPYWFQGVLYIFCILTFCSSTDYK